MITLFTETFYQIQKEFQNVFKELFGGGYAELSLSDPENLLSTGIDIVARPPGKKLKSLSLLSGGERALTAIEIGRASCREREESWVVGGELWRERGWAS